MLIKKIKNLYVPTKFKKAMKRSENVSVVPVDIDAGLFLANGRYYVSTQLGWCGCPVGNTGVFCKHQIAIKDQFGKYYKPTLPILDASDRINLYIVATGNQNVPDGFFGTQTHSIVENLNLAKPDTRNFEDKPVCLPTQAILRGDELKEKIRDISDRLCLFITNEPDVFEEPLNKFYNRIDSLSKPNLVSSLCCFGTQFDFDLSSLPAHQRGSKIPKNTAASGRRMYPADSRPQTGGRKPKGFLVQPREDDPEKYPVLGSRAMKHKLGQSIEDNVPSAKKHTSNMK